MLSIRRAPHQRTAEMGATIMKPVCLAAGVIYPGYRSFKAIESPQEGDDKQWLTYWIIFAMFTVVEFFMEFMLAWVPFYYVVRRPGGWC